MSMDICGGNPTGKIGEYFRNDFMWWGQLAEYCNMVAPGICAPCRSWYTNDRDGLDAVAAVALADALQKEIDSGRTETFARELASLLPNNDCDVCGGTGERMPGPPLSDHDLKESSNSCNECLEADYVRRWYPFSTENVAAFTAFLRESGGFSIW